MNGKWCWRISTNWTVTGTAVTNGEFRQIGGMMVGRAHDAAAVGTVVAMELEGTFLDAPCNAAASWSHGDQLYWDEANNEWTDISATGLLAAGKADADKAASATTAAVRLDNAQTAAQA